MTDIADFSHSEQWIVSTTLKERYGDEIELIFGASEIHRSQSDRELTACPFIYSQQGGRKFVISKCGDRRYRGHVYYQPYKQFGTGVRQYGDLSVCTVAWSQAQADQTVEQRGDLRTKRH